ncbi:hypothetical protein AWC38_SpisGene17852 [Stylophora pistillata]|uniref:Endonuclease/exonuclease/phosphatase domain-containing protein n=1 Tax=Stylophora pistillata TaxID=50429 RepID=A0A2B4RMS2_STYPI|nr:hypothetical protein AWC38_SpisGene17852 [Stylophora pistillata]
MNAEKVIKKRRKRKSTKIPDSLSKEFVHLTLKDVIVVYSITQDTGLYNEIRTKGAGGLMAFIWEDLSAYRHKKLEPESVKAICLDVTDSRKCRFIVCACYRSEKVNKPAEFISSLSSAIKLLCKCREEIILIGDYNLDMLVNEDEGRMENKALKDLCHRFCLFNQITEPTRITEKSQSLIDVILSSHPGCFATSGNLHLGISDHDLVFAVRKQKIPRPNALEIEYRSMKNLDEKELLEELTRVPWDSAYTFEDVDDPWDHWAKLYCEKHTTNPTDSSWEEYCKQRNKVTLLKRKGMKSFCVYASLNKKHHGEFWKKMKPLLPSKAKMQSKILLLENQLLITDPKCVAETFNDYFCNVAASDGTQMSVDEFTDHPSVKRIAEHFGPASNFDFQLIEVEYVKDILLKLNPRKAVGCVNISQRLLRITAPAIAQPLTCLINYLITSCS